MTELRTSFTSLVVLGRLRDEPGVSGAYSVPEGVEFVALPDYPWLSRPLGALRAARGTLRAFRRVLERVDAVWLLGPHPFAIAFAVQALARRRTVVLGVRMDFPAHMRARHPRRPWLAGAAAPPAPPRPAPARPPAGGPGGGGARPPRPPGPRAPTNPG